VPLTSTRCAVTRSFSTLPLRIKGAHEAEARREQRRQTKRARKAQSTIAPVASTDTSTTDDAPETLDAEKGQS
jgi:hypothetical protein